MSALGSRRKPSSLRGLRAVLVNGALVQTVAPVANSLDSLTPSCTRC